MDEVKLLPCARAIADALIDLKFGMDFAYEQGLHEFGYDPLETIRAALTRPTLVTEPQESECNILGDANQVCPRHGHSHATLVTDEVVERVAMLCERLSDEADLCRNEGADDIATLMDEARNALDRFYCAGTIPEKAAWWMIERHDDPKHRPLYFCWVHRPGELPQTAPHGQHGWTPDWQRGEHFATREEAEAHTNGDLMLRVCDHAMMQSAMPAIPPQSLGDHALPPSGSGQSSLSRAKPAAAIARGEKA